MRRIAEEELKDLHGRVAIVTGGNTGVGYATIQFLVRRGAKVYMGARDETRAMAAIKQLQEEDIGDGSVHWLNLDLSDPRLAKQAAEEFLKEEQRLDILVNNAARTADGPFKLDKDNLLDIMVTNHISPFAFTEALLPIMKDTAKEEGSDVRIINVTSRAHAGLKVDTFSGREALNRQYGSSITKRLDTYGNTKLANILHIKELQRRLDGEGAGIICVSVHPGGVATKGLDSFVSSAPFPLSLAKYIMTPFVLSWRQGAMTSAFAASSGEVSTKREVYAGAYLTPIAQITQPSEAARDARLATELYDTTSEVLRELNI